MNPPRDPNDPSRRHPGSDDSEPPAPLRPPRGVAFTRDEIPTAKRVQWTASPSDAIDQRATQEPAHEAPEQRPSERPILTVGGFAVPAWALKTWSPAAVIVLCLMFGGVGLVRITDQVIRVSEATLGSKSELKAISAQLTQMQADAAADREARKEALSAAQTAQSNTKTVAEFACRLNGKPPSKTWPCGDPDDWVVPLGRKLPGVEYRRQFITTE